MKSKKQDNGFTARTLMSLATALSARAAIDADIAAMVEALAKEHGVEMPVDVEHDR